MPESFCALLHYSSRERITQYRGSGGKKEGSVSTGMENQT